MQKISNITLYTLMFIIITLLIWGYFHILPDLKEERAVKLPGELTEELTALAVAFERLEQRVEQLEHAPAEQSRVVVKEFDKTGLARVEQRVSSLENRLEKQNLKGELALIRTELREARQVKVDLSAYYKKGEVQAFIEMANRRDIAIFEERRSSGEGAGTLSGDEPFVRRGLNSELYRRGESITLDSQSHLITLAPGTYRVEASAPAYYTVHQQLSLRDVVSGKPLLLGTVESAGVSGIQTRSHIDGIITVSESTSLELRHFIKNSQTNNALGLAVNSGESEVYARVVVERM